MEIALRSFYRMALHEDNTQHKKKAFNTVLTAP